MPQQLLPLSILLAGAFLCVVLRRTRVALAGRRARRAEADARELARLTGYFKKIKPENAGPAIVRGEDGRVDVFRGLRRYAPRGKSRRGEQVR